MLINRLEYLNVPIIYYLNKMKIILFLLLLVLLICMKSDNLTINKTKAIVCLTLSKEFSKHNQTYANNIQHFKFYKRINQILSFGLINCFNTITQIQIINVFLINNHLIDYSGIIKD